MRPASVLPCPIICSPRSECKPTNGTPADLVGVVARHAPAQLMRFPWKVLPFTPGGSCSFDPVLLQELADGEVAVAEGIPDRRAPVIDGPVALRAGRSRHHRDWGYRTPFLWQREWRPVLAATAQRHVSLLH